LEGKPPTEIKTGGGEGWNEKPTLVDWSKIGPWLIQDQVSSPEYLREILLKIRLSTTVLVIAVHGEEPDFEVFLPKYERMVETPFGLTLAACAAEARRRGPRTWAAFSASLEFPGYQLVRAVAAWLNANPTPTPLQAYLDRKSQGGLTANEEVYHHLSIQNESSEGLTALDRQFAEWSRLNAAASKKQRRQKEPQKQDTFRAIISRDWITSALWCRDNKGILNCYPWMPQGVIAEQEASSRRINTAISRLGFTKSRMQKNNDAIDAAEAKIMRQISRQVERSRTS
jgi:hypothetical protein